MSFGNLQRYVDDQFICTNCGETYTVRVDTFADLLYKGKNPLISAGHRQPYYKHCCKYCGAYHEVPWKDSSR